ncbi:purine nucleoside phosphorylase isoform X1 [Apis mellifera caucasica]|uniref:Purine nucleoside phosphorylase n=1 Tax=Apis mellifera TaxID=7460 RepID=A0A7M7R643_APIME|nr:purine nucleoside phosphorylase isoform X1 [Apis mellifera]KAG6796794.1 purine nucleoside phosphorylase isoform X1 [Apis mellifera caucasica]KAG9430603.1 purine nucleoside phosphorylase isoform X1 [Apis mellifera carnica]|eukprot:XP_391850.3 purine nucleoside phosphorylase isoform X1 [Apis mellifera]
MPFADTINGYNHQLEQSKNNELLQTVEESSHSTYTFEDLQEAAQYLLDRIKLKPKLGIICGSGMRSNEQYELCPGSLADCLENKQYIPYQEIPHFPVSTVKGHRGQMVFGYLNSVPIMCMQGRFHYYEGYPLWKCAMPVRVMKLVGVTHLIATNAAGGLNPTYKVGDIMIVKDHLNMMGFAGNNPLQGPNDDRFGPRFPPMNKAYNAELLKIGLQVAKEMGISDIVHKGVYACIGGPNFETVAELRMLKMIGVDAVGMSTVHEVITARHCDLIVFAFSLITNQCTMDYDKCEQASHEEVIAVGKGKQTLLQEYVSNIVIRLRDKLNL